MNGKVRFLIGQKQVLIGQKQDHSRGGQDGSRRTSTPAIPLLSCLPAGVGY